MAYIRQKCLNLHLKSYSCICMRRGKFVPIVMTMKKISAFCLLYCMSLFGAVASTHAMALSLRNVTPEKEMLSPRGSFCSRCSAGDLALYGDAKEGLDDMLPALKQERDSAAALETQPMQHTVLAALQKAVAMADSALDTPTLAGVTLAINTLDAVLADAHASITLYATMATRLNEAKAIYCAGALGDSYLFAAIENLQAAYSSATADVALLAALEQAQSDYEELNRIDGKIANGDMENGNNGWTTNMATIATGNNYAGFGGTFQEKWTSYGGSLGNYYSYQQFTGMPNGTYTFGAWCIATQQGNTGEACRTAVSGVYLYANDTQCAVATLNGVPQYFTVTTTVTDGTLQVGFRTRNCSANWVAFDNVSLYSFDGTVQWALGRDKATSLTPIDVTRFITNPSFEADNTVLSRKMPQGWSATGSTEACAWYGVNAANGNDDRPTAGNYLFGVWDGSVSSAGIEQTIHESLPAGYYRLTVDMLASHRDNGTLRIGRQCLFAGSDTALFKDGCQALYGDNVPLQTLSLDFYLPAVTAALPMGVCTALAPNETWFKVDNFTLAYMGTSLLTGYRIKYEQEVKLAASLMAAYPYVFGAARTGLVHWSSLWGLETVEAYKEAIDSVAAARAKYTSQLVNGYKKLYDEIEKYFYISDLTAEVAAATEILVSDTASLATVVAAGEELADLAARYEAGTLNIEGYKAQLTLLLDSAAVLATCKMETSVLDSLAQSAAQGQKVLTLAGVNRTGVVAAINAMKRWILIALHSCEAYSLLKSAVDKAHNIYVIYGSKESAFGARLNEAQAMYDDAVSSNDEVALMVQRLQQEQQIFVKQQLVESSQMQAYGFAVRGGCVPVIVTDKAMKTCILRVDGSVVRTLSLSVGTTPVYGLPAGIYLINGHKVEVSK